MNTSYIVTTYNYNSSILQSKSLVILSIISLLVILEIIISLWKIFDKNKKNGWACLVPVYNIYVMCEIADVEWYYILLLCVPIINLYAMYIIYNGVAAKQKKGPLFAVGMIILPVIFFPILAFSKKKLSY